MDRKNTEADRHAVLELDARSFDQAVRRGIALVAFYEPWCASWHLEEARLERLPGSVETPVLIGAVNIDKERELADRFRIACIPTLLLFKDGHLVRGFAGVLRESVVIKAIRAAAACEPSGKEVRQ
jgi:thioredoxin 1